MIKNESFLLTSRVPSNFNKSNPDGEFSFCVKPFSLWFISDVVVVVWKPTRSIKVQNSWEGDKIQKLFQTSGYNTETILDFRIKYRNYFRLQDKIQKLFQTCFKNLRELICNSARGCKKSLKSFYLTPFSKQESGED